MITRQLVRVIFGNIYSQFMKECGIPAISVTTRQLLIAVLETINSQFMRDYAIIAISVTTKQQERVRF